MLFKKREAKPSSPDPAADEVFQIDDVSESHRVTHGLYIVISKAKQLHNSNWIVDIVLKKEREDGNGLYDFFGPMTEYGSEDDARGAGVEHAVRRLDAESTP